MLTTVAINTNQWTASRCETCHKVALTIWIVRSGGESHSKNIPALRAAWFLLALEHVGVPGQMCLVRYKHNTLMALFNPNDSNHHWSTYYRHPNSQLVRETLNLSLAASPKIFLRGLTTTPLWKS
jgi:hypothetical protein